MLRRLARLRPGTAPAAVRTLATAVAPPKRTPLYELHAEHFAKVVTFAGYDMPLLYNGSSSANVAGGAGPSARRLSREPALRRWQSRSTTTFAPPPGSST